QRAIPTTVPAKAKCPRVARVAKQVKLKLETVIPFRLDCSRDFRRRQHDDQLAFVPPVGRTLYASHPEPVRGVFL
ncbi:MAG TPA: hypothetical protein DCE44_20395, partial [Verrucomicrobiales bacterium]|nr:hypothetical protein [Verrucomicrobiales bacterium]